MEKTSPAPGSNPLNGWKDIASYLGRSVRAVQRWERELGLPVHRIRTQDGQTVYAFRDEIDKWRQIVDARKAESMAAHNGAEHPGTQPGPGVAEPVAAPIPPARSGRPFVWLAASGILLLGTMVAGWSFLRQPEQSTVKPPAVDVQWTENVLEGIDANGQSVWSYKFDDPTARAVVDTRISSDLDGDGTFEFIVGVKFGLRRKEAPASDAVYYFTNDGHVRRRIVPTNTMTCGAETFFGPWEIKAITAENTRGPRRTWLAWTHHTWYPSFVLEINPRGDQSVRYLQAGWVIALAHWRTPAGDLLAAGGVLNEYSRASVALVDTDGPASGLHATEPKYQCGGEAAGVRRVTLFPHVETTAAPYDFVGGLRAIGADLKVSMLGGTAISRLGPDLQVKDYGIADNYFVVHSTAERAGTLDHPVEQCPFPNADKAILTWTPVNGWDRYIVRPQPWVAPKTPK